MSGPGVMAHHCTPDQEVYLHQKVVLGTRGPSVITGVGAKGVYSPLFLPESP